MVEHWAARRPDHAALLAPNRPTCTWRGLGEQLDDTAAALARLDIGPGHVVAVVVPDGPDAAAAILSTAASAACAPLNHHATEDELTASFARTGATAVIAATETGETGATGAARAAAGRCGLPVLELHSNDVAGRFTLALASGGERTARPATVEPDCTLVVETSGTTGAPKVVTRTHAQTLDSAAHLGAPLGLGPDDRSLVVLPLCFAAGRETALIAALAAGGGAICTTGFDSRRFFEWVDDLQATWVPATPTMHHALTMLARMIPERAAESSLRLLRSSSAPLGSDVIDVVEDTFRAPLLIGYGSTETGIVASEAIPPAPRKRGTVGTPAGAEIAIVGEDGAELEPGALGEIVVRSAWTSGEPARDLAIEGEGWVRMGDLGRLDEDGFLTVAGRVKELINRGGEKISPTEVETVLLAHPSVADAVVFPVPHRTLGEEVAVVVVATDGETVDLDSVRRHAVAHLTPNKVPRRIVTADAVPVSAAGKVARAGLAGALGLTELEPDLAEEPRTPLEATIARMWAQALGLDRISLTTDFLDLGGDSLAAVEVMALVEEECGVRVPEEWLVQEQATVRALAALIEAAAGGASPVTVGPVALRIGDDRRLPFFCLPGIRGNALMLHRLARASTSDRPFYGLRAPGLAPGEIPPAQMADLAALHLDNIRTIQPNGPYTIGGYSFGGLIAWEMARQLRAQGETVERIVIIDTFAPGFPGKASFAHRVRHAVNRRLRNRRRRRQATARLPRETAARTADFEHIVERVKVASRQASRAYRPPSLDVPVVVLSTEQRRARVGGDATLGWRTIALGPLETEAMPGRHRTATDSPHVEILGGILGAILDRPPTRGS